MSPVRVCVYDNPATCCREVWVNGERGSFWTQELLLTRLEFGGIVSKRPWLDGQVSGNATALVEETQP